MRSRSSPPPQAAPRPCGAGLWWFRDRAEIVGPRAWGNRPQRERGEGSTAPTESAAACGRKRAPGNTAQPPPPGWPLPCFQPRPTRRPQSPASGLRESTQLPRYPPCALDPLFLSPVKTHPHLPKSSHLGSPGPLLRGCPHLLPVSPSRPGEPEPWSAEETERAVAAPVTAGLTRWAVAGSALSAASGASQNSKARPPRGTLVSASGKWAFYPNLGSLRPKVPTHNSALGRMRSISETVD